MAKKLVRVKGTDQVTKQLKKVFDSAKREKRLLNDIGKFTVDRIKFQTRTGKRARDNKLEPLPKLKDSTKSIRKGIQEKRPDLVDPTFFKPSRSNITLTGQLLNSLNYIVKGDRVFLFFKDRRSKKVTPKDTTSNNQVYEDLKKRGFDFIGLDEKGQKAIRKLVLDEFRRTIKKIFK